MTAKTYGELWKASKEVKRNYTERALEILASLEEVDRDLVNNGLDLLSGNREALAVYLMRPIPALNRRTCYEALAAGERSRAVQLFEAVRHGIFL